MDRGPAAIELPGDRGGDGLVVVGDLERPEAVVTDVQGLGRVGAPALTTAQPRNKIHGVSSSLGHWHLARPPTRGGRELVLVAAASPGPVPQPLWMIPPWWTNAGSAVNAGPGRPSGRVPDRLPVGASRPPRPTRGPRAERRWHDAASAPHGDASAGRSSRTRRFRRRADAGRRQGGPRGSRCASRPATRRPPSGGRGGHRGGPDRRRRRGAPGRRGPGGRRRLHRRHLGGGPARPAPGWSTGPAGRAAGARARPCAPRSRRPRATSSSSSTPT